jgi:glyoxylase-like metal-dependent hydrolase (beta-lactamase superfamily II)
MAILAQCFYDLLNTCWKYLEVIFIDIKGIVMKLKNNYQSKLAILISALFLQIITPSFAIAEPVVEKETLFKYQTQPGFYRYKLGNYEITSLSDGSVPQDLHALLKGGSQSEVNQLLTNAHLQSPVEASINAFLINTGTKIILVDTGAGGFFGPGYGGKLIERLKNIGYGADQITDILITHVHTDHTGGLVKDGQAAFPNATIYIGKADLDFFLNVKNQNGANGYDKAYFQQATAALTPYVKLGHISPISGSKLLFPGVNAMPTPGHTPGHYFYKVESAGKSITFIGDSIHVESVQFPKPEITITYDVDQPAAAKQRAIQFERMAKEGSLIAAPHLPYPGIGYINQATEGYKFIRAEFHDREGI